jgi:hypothetical protein
VAADDDYRPVAGRAFFSVRGRGRGGGRGQFVTEAKGSVLWHLGL